MTKLNWEEVSPKLGTWAESFKPFYEKGGFDAIYEELRSRSKLGYKVIPENKDTFRSFIETPIDKLQVLFYLQDPYPWIKPNKEGKRVVVANGVAMDCRNTGICQPSLTYFYEGVALDLYGSKKKTPEYFKNPSLEHLTSQGVMLLNSDLTTELNLKGGHQGLWKGFMDFFLTEIINTKFVGLPIIFAGANSQNLAKFADPLRHKIMYCEHPASAAYGGRHWDTTDTLSKKNKEVPVGIITKTNYYLKDKGVKINWLEEEAPW